MKVARRITKIRVQDVYPYWGTLVFPMFMLLDPYIYPDYFAHDDALKRATMASIVFILILFHIAIIYSVARRHVDK